MVLVSGMGEMGKSKVAYFINDPKRLYIRTLFFSYIKLSQEYIFDKIVSLIFEIFEYIHVQCSPTVREKSFSWFF